VNSHNSRLHRPHIASSCPGIVPFCKQLPRDSSILQAAALRVFISVGHKGKSIEKRIIRDTPELVSSFVVRPCAANGARITGGRGVTIRFVNRLPIVPHWAGYERAAARTVLRCHEWKQCAGSSEIYPTFPIDIIGNVGYIRNMSGKR
jgi:hypothetical protein